MLDGSRLFNRALAVVRDCLGSQRGEELLILWDGSVSEELVAASRSAGLALGARPQILSFEPAVNRPMREYGLFAGASLRESPSCLPRAALGAIRGCDRLLLATSDSSVLFSGEAREAMRHCAAASFSYLTSEAALRLLPETGEEVRALAELTRRVAREFAGAHRVHVTSPAGTDLAMSLGQYPTIVVQDGTISPGSRQTLPAGQVSRVPDDGSAEGVLVIDRSIGANDYKELREPVWMTVERGFVTSVEGGPDAGTLRRFLAAMEDRAIYHLTELGVGTNRRCRFTGVAAPCEDTHALGAVSLALGADVHLGGNTRAGAHIDMTMRWPSLELDGELIVDEGKLLLE